MNKLTILGAASLMMLASCKKDFGDMNVDQKNASQVPAEMLFSNSQKNFADAMASPSVNLNIWRLIAQHWTETTYTDESNYDLNTRNIPQGFWTTIYRDVLVDLKESNRLLEADAFLDPKVKANQLALNDILQVQAYSTLLNTFGDIPYSQALDYNNLKPTYDDGLTIAKDLINRLNQDIAALDAAAGAFPDADLYYHGDIDAWKKYANSLKLKLGMLLADADATTAKAAVESAVASGVFTSNDDNALLQYLAAPPNTNPIWVNLVQSGRKDFVAANTIVDAMKTVADPRIPYFFTEDANGGYTGGKYGASNNYATYSKPAEAITDPSYAHILLGYEEVEFLLAEAVERNFAVGGTAADHYNKAITASMEAWGVPTAQITAYLANPKVAYATATGNYKQKIGFQKWIALYNRSFDAWIEWRRLDYPVLVKPENALSDIPVRYTYPFNEQNLNKANYDAAASKIGGDKVTTKLFWDKF
ncbi:SusD/RagB family nutrient-binding outer membrane lipoprotein [Flavihumibacter rivuli]|uniref:SusD/RagB family nutrient-binding outer membrane lipoprotein n=1 Tax=Flavihumibacter rivuli TaxID=2838156 RepID=UPI001BDE97F0|nr:SusD/RagB family nutrient-binding outer membrane lipoprotein [Flavihumibacter rivuli]ULQ56780.1 SusD/RagB family nutrient-binding outer membrane lipoprotein [Flavihumibacter rivuli]